MKFSLASKKELPLVSFGIFLLSALTCLGFFVCGYWANGVWISALVGSLWVVINLIILDITVQKVVACEDQKRARAMMQFSYSMRSLGTLVICIVCFSNFQLYAVPVIAAQFYLRLVILVLTKLKLIDSEQKKEEEVADEH